MSTGISITLPDNTPVAQAIVDVAKAAIEALASMAEPAQTTVANNHIQMAPENSDPFAQLWPTEGHHEFVNGVWKTKGTDAGTTI